MIKSGKFLESFSDYLEFQRNFSIHTVLSYKRDIQQFFNFVFSGESSSLEDLTLENVYEFLSQSSFSPRTKARFLSSLKHFFHFLKNFKSVDLHSMSGISSLQIQKVQKNIPQFLDVEDIKKLLSQINKSNFTGLRDFLLISIMYSCGLRVSEVSSIKKINLDLIDNWLKIIGKGSKERYVPLHNTLCKDIERYIKMGSMYNYYEKSPFLFVNKQGNSLSRISIWKIVKKYCYNILSIQNVYPHIFRHSFATHLLSNGADLMILKTLLGHSNLSTTKIYTHVQRDDLKLIINQYHPANFF